MDVDHFKSVNDAYGHRIGDAVLKHLATVAKSQLTRGQLLYRTGGEEFAVFLAHTPHSLARVTAELIRQAVEAAAFVFNGAPIQVTVSLGVACFEAGDDVARLYERADKLLYSAKASGRNRVA